MKIGVIDIDGNTHYDKIFASAVLAKSKEKCEQLQMVYEDRITIGGTGVDNKLRLPAEIESCKVDYDLYTVEMIEKRTKGIMTKAARRLKAQQIVDAGIGFTSRGCVRQCKFCFVPEKEGSLKQDSEIKDIINPRSNVIILHDNNLTADPDCIDKLHEIRDRKLIVDINQGCDVRLMTDDIAKALSEVNHLRSLHYAWDLMGFEDQVMRGIETLSKYVKRYKHMCFMLVGFNTTFEEDVYRFKKLVEMKVDPYVMRYNDLPDDRLKHFERWVNSRIYKSCSFEDYEPWVKSKFQLQLL